jgi:hypothetical protein
VRGVLGAADLGGAPTVGGVSLFGAQLGEDRGGSVAACGRLLRELFAAALLAVPASTVG